jgi:hypothetical protein
LVGVEGKTCLRYAGDGYSNIYHDIDKAFEDLNDVCPCQKIIMDLYYIDKIEDIFKYENPQLNIRITSKDDLKNIDGIIYNDNILYKSWCNTGEDCDVRYVDSILEEHKDHIINETDETENKWCIWKLYKNNESGMYSYEETRIKKN